ncbi:AraC family transcriptional regulator [Pseudodesulfovibrio sp. zrk46]|uniref:AraC family transcriptional regulator n=1 Tax=Pseudodesulfovibrio sp. zrk46 TaxID=2725288 RepID=UPI001FFC5E6C|nr:AraC family transcriptional regulator [Pseudodesulfovibrio sp. zrk46]
MLYNPGLCIVASGAKVGHLGGQSFHYDADNYLVVSVTMPFESESFPDEDEPLLGVYIDIDMGQLNDLIRQMDLQADFSDLEDKGYPLGIGPSTMDEDMKDAVTKLLKALRSEREAKILAPGLVREIYYRALCGSQAQVLYSLAKGNSSFAQVGSVISLMEGNYNEKLDVQQLAESAHMSVSAFHKAFKEITADSPLQYLKKIRLARAKDLIIQENMKAYLAADAVGYESPSQFSREFKRHFGQSPAEVIREIRSS